jgi:hypothetical protein
MLCALPCRNMAITPLSYLMSGITSTCQGGINAKTSYNCKLTVSRYIHITCMLLFIIWLSTVHQDTKDAIGQNTPVLHWQRTSHVPLPTVRSRWPEWWDFTWFIHTGSFWSKERKLLWVLGHMHLLRLLTHTLFPPSRLLAQCRTIT